MRAAALLLLLAGCQRAEPEADTPGARLEAAAVARGLVPDPNSGSLVGSWASETDRLCLVPRDDRLTMGVLVDYGEGQGCAGSGTAERRGERLKVAIDACRFDATYDGERISFPANLPDGCSALCTGRASLTALSVTRLSESGSEAATLRTPSGRLLCGG